MRNRFQTNSGCFRCELCGKLTRRTDNNSNLCDSCFDELKQENE